jgi:hypothetical protein
MRDFFAFLGAEMPRVIARWRASRSMASNGADDGRRWPGDGTAQPSNK